MIVMSSLIFCFAHIFVINWVAPLLGFFGGLLLALTYSKTKSLLLVSLNIYFMEIHYF